MLSDALALEAEILHAQGNFIKAKITVDGVLRGMAATHMPQGKASALRGKAAVHFALGEPVEARAAIEDVIALLSAGVTPDSLRRAYALSARITGNGRHERVAREFAELGFLHA